MTGVEKEKWAVVGGGILGLTLALRLRQQGHSVTLLEGADELGGLASTWDLGPIHWDKHYHVTLLSDSYTRGIAAELGLTERFRWVETKTGFFANGRMHPLSSSLDYLRLPVMSMVDKFRLAATILYASKLKNWEPLEAIPIDQWLTRLSGKRVFERIWKPLLKAKLGENYRHASAAFIWAVIARLYAARRTGLKKEMFGYVEGGYASFLAAFHSKLLESGVEILTGHRVESVHPLEDGAIEVRSTKKPPLRFDHAILTCAAPLAAKIAPNLRDSEKQRLGSIRYQGIICASMLLDEPLGESYLTYITDEMPFTAVVEMSTLVNRSELRGKSLVYLPKYVDSEDIAFDTPDEEIEQRFLQGLERMFPELPRRTVRAFRISRVKHVLPIPALHYSKMAPPLQTSIPGLYIACSAQIVNGTLNVNETIRLAEETAEALREQPPKTIPLRAAA